MTGKLCYIVLTAVLLCCFLGGCGQISVGIIGGADGPTQIIISDSSKDGEAVSYSFEQITPQRAKELMDSENDYTVLDVRERDEYDAEHIPGAVLLPYERVDELAEELLPDKEQLILVYCRSGRRSKVAAEALAALGYSNVREFGGINDWPYETVTE